MLRRSLSLLVPMVLSLGVGCSPMIKVNVLKPAPVNLGAAKQLSVVETTGRRSAREHVINQIAAQSRSSGYYTFADRSEEGITVKVSGQQVTATAGANSKPQQPNEIGLKIDVLEWTANSETLPEKRDEKTGKITQKERKVWKGKVLLGVTAFDANGRAKLAETEYEGIPTVEETEEDAIRSAANSAVSKLLWSITPRYEAQMIRMDNEDKGQEPIIKVAEGGNLERATTEMRAYLNSNKNAAAMYNMAVLLDAQGQYQEALDLYTQAISQSSKDFYVDMKTQCAKRLADQQAMAGQ